MCGHSHAQLLYHQTVPQLKRSFMLAGLTNIFQLAAVLHSAYCIFFCLYSCLSCTTTFCVYPSYTWELLDFIFGEVERVGQKWACAIAQERGPCMCPVCTAPCRLRAVDSHGVLTELVSHRRYRDELGRTVGRSSTVNKTVTFLKSV